MKPPICSICKKDFRSKIQEGGRITFKLTDKEKKRKEEMKERRMVGHPPGLHWFCKRHLAIAKKYRTLTYAEAKPKIIKESFIGYRLFSRFFKSKDDFNA